MNRLIAIRLSDALFDVDLLYSRFDYETAADERFLFTRHGRIVHKDISHRLAIHNMQCYTIPKEGQ